MKATKLDDSQIKQKLNQLSNGWQLNEGHQLEKQFQFKKYLDALEFVNQVAKLAESINHHPDIYFGYNQVKITLWTHSINGLSDNDFNFAAQVNKNLK